MATTTTWFESGQNSYAGNEVLGAVTHTAPDVRHDATIDTLLISLAAEFTGTGSNNVTVGASGAITANAVSQVDPITGVALDWDHYRQLRIVVKRAVAAVAPTGSVSITSTGFMGMTLSALTVPENSSISFRLGANKAASNTEALVINLTGTTGYKVSVLAVGKST